ncbi:hypothetical protein L7F22_003587 [Adiantum nelumboides]|nr:hypothetical protein [Adiantum nelumboides]
MGSSCSVDRRNDDDLCRPRIVAQSIKHKTKKRKKKKMDEERKKHLLRALSAEAQTSELLSRIPGRIFNNGSTSSTCAFTQQGKKGTNQDAMLVWEHFASRHDTLLCCVFDGHGPYGHLVARKVRDTLPTKLMGMWKARMRGDIGILEDEDEEEDDESDEGDDDDDVDENLRYVTNDVWWKQVQHFEDVKQSSVSCWGDESEQQRPGLAMRVWRECLMRTFRGMDRDLRMQPTIDCFCSGTTAIILLQQGMELIMGNVGDSRAVLATFIRPGHSNTRGRRNKRMKEPASKLQAIQLTLDLKPNLPSKKKPLLILDQRHSCLTETGIHTRVYNTISISMMTINHLQKVNKTCSGCHCISASSEEILKEYGACFVYVICSTHICFPISHESWPTTKIAVFYCAGEAERIRRCKGRVFAMEDEPDVARVWLPYDNAPGLAMARAFGDFCLKEYGLISVPDITYRMLTPDDQFVILATDGIWDVMSNSQAVEVVALAPSRVTAARLLVETAIRAWRFKYPTSKVDDCAVICLFFHQAASTTTMRHNSAITSTYYYSEEDEEEHDGDDEKEDEEEEEIIAAEDTPATTPCSPPSHIKKSGTVQASEPSYIFEPNAVHGVDPKEILWNPASTVGGTSSIHHLDVQSSPNETPYQGYFVDTDEASPPSVLEIQEVDLPGSPSMQRKGKEQAALSPPRRSLAEHMRSNGDDGEEDDEWSALEGVVRVNSIVNLPRFKPPQ